MAGPGRQRVTALALAALGLLALVGAQFMPWVAVRTADTLDRLFGEDPEQAARGYRLVDLSEAAIPLLVGWVVLFGAFAAAWVKPDWRRMLLRLVCVADVVIVFLTFDLGRHAVDASGARASDNPAADIQSGALLALLGALLVTVALGTLMAPGRARPENETSQPPAAPPGHDPRSMSPSPQPTTVSQARASQSPVATGWSARPEWVPWWRRRGPVTALVLGVITAVAVAGGTAWFALNRPPAPRDHPSDLREFLVDAPVGSAPNPDVIGTDGRLSISQATQLIDAAEPGDIISLLGMRRAVTEGWTEGNGTSVTVTLIQFGSNDEASGFLETYCRRARTKRISESATTTGPQGSQSFVDPARDDKGRVQVDAIAQRQDVVLLITEAQPGSVDVARVHALVQDQYDRL
ncbi:hypothetical protein SAMN05444858_12757 [Micromonospora avicenniae]|uniref:Uncharacterized protein n=1 Tax=Micromonospora avicenniae TaxID=1198245 RepID=A0A1N7EV21_9ACTN|nr:hypothetical protein SAMN05444858_12757 [Micromonospora avicenniae]